MTPQEINDLLGKYGFTLMGNKLVPQAWNSGDPNGQGDLRGLQADPAFRSDPFLSQRTHVVTPEEKIQLADPHGPGNGEGGSDLANIMTGVGFVTGGAGLLGGLTPGMNSALSLGKAGLSLANGNPIGAITSGLNTNLGNLFPSTGTSSMDLPFVDDWNFDTPNLDNAGTGFTSDFSGQSDAGATPYTIADSLGRSTPGVAGNDLYSMLQKYGPDALKLATSSGIMGNGVAGPLSKLFGGGDTNLGGYKFPWENVIGSILGTVGANKNINTLSDAIKAAADRADPFASQRPKYQGQLQDTIDNYKANINDFSNASVNLGNKLGGEYQSLDKDINSGYNNLSSGLRTDYGSLAGGLQKNFDTARGGYQQGFDNLFGNANKQWNQMQSPDYWNKDSLLSGLNDMAVNDTSRKLASQGYNMSGNVPMEVAQRLQQNNANYVPSFMNAWTGGTNSLLNNYTSNANNNLGQINSNNNTQLGGFNTMSNTQIGGYNTNGGNRYSSFGTNAGNQFNNLANNQSSTLRGLGDLVSNTGTFAGGKIDPANASTIQANGALNLVGLNNQMYGNMGAGLQSIFSGRQPSAVEQLFGTPRNQTLSGMFSGLMNDIPKSRSNGDMPPLISPV